MKEKIKNSIQRVKAHFNEHKEAYITGGVCLVVGTAAGVVVGAVVNENIKVTPTALVVGNHNVVDQSTIINVVRKGHPGKVILDPLTNIQYPSINAAAKALGVSAPTIRVKIDCGDLVHLGDALAPTP